MEAAGIEPAEDSRRPARSLQRCGDRRPDDVVANDDPVDGTRPQRNPGDGLVGQFFADRSERF